MVTMGVKTVVVDKETCLLSERSAKRVEDGRRGRRGEGCTVVKANGRQRLCHTLSLIWQLPISPPHQSIARNTRPHTKKSFFPFLFRGEAARKRQQTTGTRTPQFIEGSIYTGEGKRRSKVWSENSRQTKIQGVRMRNLCGPCAPEY